MRTAISTIQCDASVNKVAISDDSHHTLAIPFDNRHVRLYDIQVSDVRVNDIQVSDIQFSDIRVSDLVTFGLLYTVQWTRCVGNVNHCTTILHCSKTNLCTFYIVKL